MVEEVQEVEPAMEMEEVAFQLIGHAGSARSSVFDALSKLVAGDRVAVDRCLSEASDELIKAHRAQMDLLRREASGQPVTPSILLVHAQDILMAASTERDLTEKIIQLYDVLSEGLVEPRKGKSNGRR